MRKSRLPSLTLALAPLDAVYVVPNDHAHLSPFSSPALGNQARRKTNGGGEQTSGKHLVNHVCYASPGGYGVGEGRVLELLFRSTAGTHEAASRGDGGWEKGGSCGVFSEALQARSRFPPLFPHNPQPRANNTSS